MKKIRLTESELTDLIRNIVNETEMKEMEYVYNPEAMQTGAAIWTIVGTIIGMLGIAGSHYIKAAIKKLRREGNDEEADKVEAALEKEMSKIEDKDTDMGEKMMESRISRRTRRR